MRLGGAGAGGRSAEARAPGDQRPELVDSGAARTPHASPRARHLANPAAAPAVRTSAATGLAGGGELRVARRGADARL